MHIKRPQRKVALLVGVEDYGNAGYSTIARVSSGLDRLRDQLDGDGFVTVAVRGDDAANRNTPQAAIQRGADELLQRQQPAEGISADSALDGAAVSQEGPLDVASTFAVVYYSGHGTVDASTGESCMVAGDGSVVPIPMVQQLFQDVGWLVMLYDACRNVSASQQGTAPDINQTKHLPINEGFSIKHRGDQHSLIAYSCNYTATARDGPLTDELIKAWSPTTSVFQIIIAATSAVEHTRCQSSAVHMSGAASKAFAMFSFHQNVLQDKLGASPVVLHGRDSEKKAVRSALSQTRLCVIEGGPGEGKTALAETVGLLLFNAGKFPGGAYKVDLRGVTGGVVDSFAQQLASLLSDEGCIPPLTSQEPWEAVQYWLRHPFWKDQPALILIDNADEALRHEQGVTELQQLLQTIQQLSGTAAVMMTSRCANLLALQHRPVVLEPLHNSAAVELLKERCTANLEREPAEVLWKLCIIVCRCNPLMLLFVAAAISNGANIQEILELSHPGGALDGVWHDDPYLSTGYMNSLKAWWRVMLQRFLTQDELQGLAKLAIFPANFSLDAANFVASGSSSLSRHLLASLRSRRVLQSVEGFEDYYTMHPVLREVAFSMLEVQDIADAQAGFVWHVLSLGHKLSAAHPIRAKQLLQAEVVNVLAALKMPGLRDCSGPVAAAGAWGLCNLAGAVHQHPLEKLLLQHALALVHLSDAEGALNDPIKRQLRQCVIQDRLARVLAAEGGLRQAEALARSALDGARSALAQVQQEGSESEALQADCKQIMMMTSNTLAHVLHALFPSTPQQVLAALWPAGSHLPYLKPWSAAVQACCLFTSSPQWHGQPSANPMATHKGLLQEITQGSIIIGLGSIVAVTVLRAPHSCSSQQLLSWLQQWQAKIAAIPELPGETLAGGVFTACVDGGVVAVGQDAQGRYIPPGSIACPQIHWLDTRVLPMASVEPASGVSLQLTGHMLQAADMLQVAHMGSESLWSVPLGEPVAAQEGAGLIAAAGPATAAEGTSTWSATLPAAVVTSEGLVWLSVRRGCYASPFEPLLVLDITPDTARQLNTMAITQPGPAMLHWLYHLLLQPDTDVQSLLKADLPVASHSSDVPAAAQVANDSNSSSSADVGGRNSGDSATEMLSAVVQTVIEQDLKCLGLSWQAAPNQGVGVGDRQKWLQLRLAASRATAAYYLLAVSVVLKQAEVATWLLGKLPSLPDGLLIIACLAAQQRLAWAEATGVLQVPLLFLVTASEAPVELVQVLHAWGEEHSLPEADSWDGVTIGELQACTHASTGDAASAEDQRRRIADSNAVASLQDAVAMLLHSSQLLNMPPVAIQQSWQMLASEPNLALATSLQELGTADFRLAEPACSNNTPKGGTHDGNSSSSSRVQQAVNAGSGSGTGSSSNSGTGSSSSSSSSRRGASGNKDLPLAGSSSGGSGKPPLMFECSQQPYQQPQVVSDVDAMSWFTGRAEGEGMEWPVFWYLLSKQAQNNLGSNLHLSYLQHKLNEPGDRGVHTPQQRHFEHVFCNSDDHRIVDYCCSCKNYITRSAFSAYASGKSLAGVIDWCMRVGWSPWVDNSQLPETRGPVLAEAGITGWRVGIQTSWPSSISMGLLSFGRPCRVVASLEGWQAGGREGHGAGYQRQQLARTCHHDELGGQPTQRYSSLSGRYVPAHQPRISLFDSGTAAAAALTAFLTSPQAGATHGAEWQCNAGHCICGCGEGHFTGYQLRVMPGRIASARFLYMRSEPLLPAALNTALDVVFISHTGSDPKAAQFANLLHESLRKERIASFFDAESLRPADVWVPRILEAVQGCRVFVAIISPTYPTRKWPLLELHLALQRASAGATMLLLPVLYDVRHGDLRRPQDEWRSAWQGLRDGNTSPIPGLRLSVQQLASEAEEDLAKVSQQFQTTGLSAGKTAPGELLKIVVEGCRVCKPAW